jgi:serine/threonine-protein kinase SRPK3
VDDVEDLENYKPGGFHPVALGDTLADGRYRVLHKLGSGRSATVWLALDLDPRAQQRDTLVTLKVLSTAHSSVPRDRIAALHVPRQLNKLKSPAKNHVQLIRNPFVEPGPNGRHLCLVSPFAGPSVLSMTDCPGRMSGSRRLRGDLARKVAKQAAVAVDFMHTAGFVHGGPLRVSLL